MYKRQTLDIPVTKTTGGLLAIPKDHPLLERKSPKLNLQLIMSVCCQCSMCTQMCPRNALGLNVQPHKAIDVYKRQGLACADGGLRADGGIRRNDAARF